MTTIQDAWIFAQKAHEGQLDDLGTDYFQSHILHVYNILQAGLNHPNAMFTDEKRDILYKSALLHDTVEDCGVSIETIREEFGEDIATIVHAVTHTGIKDKFGYYFPRLLVEERYDELIHMAVIIKFADRMSNIIRGGGWSLGRMNKYLKRSIFWKTERIVGNPLQDDPPI